MRKRQVGEFTFQQSLMRRALFAVLAMGVVAPGLATEFTGTVSLMHLETS